MERLTDPCWKNLDPWECCGQDYYCKRGGHDKGGCTNGCIVPKLYARLAAYEDTGLTPEEIKAPFTEDTMINLEAQALGVEPSRLRELAEADRNHQIVIRPCKIGDTVWAADTEPVIPLHVMADAVYLEGRHGGDYERLSNFGSVVFLSQEEAKEAASHWMK